MNAASAINQFRIHSGYHYPRSPETIRETMEARQEFMDTYAPAIVRSSQHYYAIPFEGSQTPPELFEHPVSAKAPAVTTTAIAVRELFRNAIASCFADGGMNMPPSPVGGTLAQSGGDRNQLGPVP